MFASMNRRQLLATAAALASATVAAGKGLGQQPYDGSQKPSATPMIDAGSVSYCLNTSTIRGQRLSLVEEVELAAKAGYQGIEPWVREIQQHAEGGGNLADLRKRIADLGLVVPSAIGFANWIADDEATRQEGLETAKRDMALVESIGGTRIAAPPAGATNGPGLDLRLVAQRYRALLDVGQQIGVTPQLELWGFSSTLSRLGELMFVAVESGHPDACLLPDVYHIYKGGSDFTGLKLINGHAIHVFHMNDYPQQPPRESIGDGDRVYPGDGVAPLTQIVQDLYSGGFHGVLSLELFNRDYWRQDAVTVAKTGLEKMQAAVAKAQSTQ